MKKTFWSFLLSERLDSAGEMVQSAAVVASTGFDGTVQIHSKMAHHVLNLKFPTSLAIDPSCTMLAVRILLLLLSPSIVLRFPSFLATRSSAPQNESVPSASSNVLLLE
eukprot:m.122969 g.122969  ORF g.122969 m.122969 type:complete len:109 (-) comp52136_c0_seq7:942-1268(-)